ncbi:MAG: GIY-YIG nuclease family protein [Thermoleophilia bacterium]|jgi:Uri superfamily endonuclease|nr:GIY-YIG nuclease family protein [Thermoleophilia bacterium]
MTGDGPEDTLRRENGDRRESGEDALSPKNALYVVATWVPRRLEISVGALGPVVFERGWYAYVGSARRGRDARVARHFRREKPLRWHADYLFTAAPPRLAGLVDGPLTECELAGALAAPPGASRPVRRFGAGDCRCTGHLVRLTTRPSSRTLREIGERGSVIDEFVVPA